MRRIADRIGTDPVIPSAARDLGRMRSDRCPLYVYILSSQTACSTPGPRTISIAGCTSTRPDSSRIHARIPRHPPRLLRMPREHPRRRRARAEDQGLAAREETRLDRNHQRRLARPRRRLVPGPARARSLAALGMTGAVPPPTFSHLPPPLPSRRAPPFRRDVRIRAPAGYAARGAESAGLAGALPGVGGTAGGARAADARRHRSRLPVRHLFNAYRDRRATLTWADSVIGEAFVSRSPEVKWVLPPALRKVARRSPGIVGDPDQMGQAMLRAPKLRTCPSRSAPRSGT